MTPQPDSGANRRALGVVCSACRKPLLPSPQDRCGSCHRTVTWAHPNLLDLLGSDTTDGHDDASRVLGWPRAIVDALGPWLLGDGPIPEAEGLLDSGLLVGERRTSLGRRLGYHLAEETWQTEDGWLAREARATGLDERSRVLDVGCGAGQSLRVLEPFRPEFRAGVDTALAPIALGCRLDETEERSPLYIHGTAANLPFPDASFSHIVCRVALNYMHQSRSLTEMVRVLSPGGFLLLQVETLRFDAAKISGARSLRERAARVRDLVLGIGLATTGLQAVPGSRRWAAGRGFVARWRLTRMLGERDMVILREEVNPGSNRFLGRYTQRRFVTQKQSQAGA